VPAFRTEPSSPPRLDYLDGVRALAALYVVVFHATGFVDKSALSPLARATTRLLAFGHDAVAVFIVLSGYCLMLPAVRGGGGRLSRGIGGYFVRRAWRILPPYYAALAGSLAVLALCPSLRAHTGTAWDESNPAFRPGPLLSHLFVVHNFVPAWKMRINGPLWSIATEWQIYFFFPFVLLPLWRRAGAVPTLGVAFLLGYLPIVVAPGAIDSAVPWYLGAFALGMVAAGIGFADRPLERALRRRVPWQLLAVGLWAFCAASGLVLAKIWFRHTPTTDAIVATSTAALLVVCTAHRSGAATGGAAPWVLRVLDSRPLVGLGRFSYSLYLIHLPVLALCFLAVREIPLSPEARLVTMLVVGPPASVAVAYGFFLAIERRFLHSQGTRELAPTREERRATAPDSRVSSGVE
jgi:peptidoglycan/LPS O-acetylase OafA/YrhL